MPPAIDFANYENLVELELFCFGTYESGQPVNLSHHQKLERLILIETELKTESNEFRTVFRNSNFGALMRKMEIIIGVFFENLKRTNRFPSLKYLKVYIDFARFDARAKQLLRYIAGSANQLQEIEFESTDKEIHAHWYANRDDSKNAWIEKLVSAHDSESETSSSDNENE